MPRKLLMLGGARFQIPAIKKALAKGYEVITCDNVASNPGHAFAHGYHPVSTTDLDGILSVAKREGINGIVCYASDPAAPTAAYVSEALGFPTNPFKSVEILCNKDKFRQFLSDNGFLCPKAKGFEDVSEARRWVENVGYPVMVKPVDSSGSKGVSKIDGPENLDKQVSAALAFSRSKRFILEEYVHQDGPQLCGDGFVRDGKLVFSCFGDDHMNTDGVNPFASVLLTFPHSKPAASMAKLLSEIQRAFDLLGIVQGPFNFDARIRADGEPYIMEIGPRSGGGYMPQFIEYATGIDLVGPVIDAAMGVPYPGVTQTEPIGAWGLWELQCYAEGIYQGLEIDETFRKNHLVEVVSYVDPGTVVHPYRGSHDSLGILIAKFPDMSHLERAKKEFQDLVKAKLVG